VSRPERILHPGRSALDRFGYELRQLRKERGYSLARLAGVVYVSADLLQRIETAERRPSQELAGQLDKALQADGVLLERWRELSAECGAREATAMSPDQGRRVIQALDVIGNDRLGDLADSLAGLIDHYALTICALPPADVYDELLAVRSHASGIIEHAGFAPQRTDLVAATGWLSNLLAVAACDMGEHAAARVWCSDAERRSQDARCPELAAWAVLTRAMIAYYQGQPRQSVTLAAKGREAVPIGTVIHAKLATQEMRAAAMVGDAARMTDARSYAAKAIAELSPDAKVTGAFSIALGEDPPYTATSLLLIGRFREAVSATNRVIQTVYQPEARQRGEHPSGYARSLLILGLAQAGVGRLDEAVAAGHSALAGSRPAWPTMVLAGKLDQVLARDFADARQSEVYHARYLDATSHPTGHHLQLPSSSEGRG
jgi:transcriptional regulator with XRE-family HTH domain